MKSSHARRMAVLLSAAILGSVVTFSPILAAQPPSKTANPKNPPAKPAPLTGDQLQAKAWSEFYAGQFKPAITDCDKLLAEPSEIAKWEAAHCKARCLWAQGTEASQRNARMLWGELSKATASKAKVRMKIAEALVLASHKVPAQSDKAIGVLADVLKSDSAGTATAEAAIELGILYTQVKRFDDADKTLHFVGKYLAKDNLVRLETSEDAAKPFRQAAVAALKQLGFARDAGREAFENAEKLRLAKKFAQALPAYQAIVKDFPQTDYAVRSDFTIGYCYMKLDKPLVAVEHWKRFVAASPAGPWRGQAYAGLIDLQLERMLDVTAAATYSDMAEHALAGALADEKLALTWKPIAFDLRLRRGIVQLLQHKDQDAAATFAEARKSAPSQGMSGNLAVLIAAAKAGQPLIPTDVQAAGSPPDKASFALSLGILYHAIKKDSDADALFDRVLKDRLIRHTPAQEAFAAFGKALVLLANDKADPAETKNTLIAAIKADPQGSWQDETLYQLASFIQDQADAAYQKEEYTVQHNAPDRAPSEEEGKKQQKAEEDRQAKLVALKSEALPYWHELLAKYPKSPKAEPALYCLAVLKDDIAAHAPDDKSDAAFAQAMSTLKEFTNQYPQSVWAGNAYVRQIDIALERMFELKQADALATSGSSWISLHEKPIHLLAATAPPEPWRVAVPAPDAATMKFFVYDLRLRTILTAYLSEKFDQAKKLLAAAGPIQPKDGRIDPANIEHIGLFLLQKAIIDKKPIWQPQVIAAAQTERQSTAIKLADLYLRVLRPEKTAAIYERILKRDKAFAPSVPAIEVYACIELARSYSYDRKNHQRALDVLEMLYDPAVAREPMVPDGLVWLGTLTYNFTQNPKKSMPHFEYVIKRYPDSPAAERAMYFLCLNAIAAKDKTLVEKDCKSFLATYPNSPWAKYVASLLKDQIPKLSQTGKETK